MSRLARAPLRSSPRHDGQALGGRRGQVLGEGGDREVELVLGGVGRRQHRAQPGLRGLVVGAVHPQQRRVRTEGRSRPSRLVGRGAAHQGVGIVGDGGAVAVPDGEVLGPHRRAVGRLPPEGAAVDGRGNAPPHHGVVEAGQLQQLGHLGDVAEHVGEVADRHGPAERLGPGQAQLKVADDRLARHQELVHQDVPGAHRQPPGLGQRAERARAPGRSSR